MLQQSGKATISVSRLFGSLLPLLIALALVACGGPQGDRAGTDASHEGQKASTPAPTQVTLFAAASLTDVLNQAAAQLSSEGIDLLLNLAGSQQLVTQLENGAEADLVATADVRTMKQLEAQGVVDEWQLFASNRLVIVTPASAPLGSVRDLASVQKLVLPAEAVPAGAYARQAFKALDATYGSGWSDEVLAHVVSNETNVRQALQKVVLGEADASVVYETDAKSAQGHVATLPLPAEVQPEITYPIALVHCGAHPEAARHVLTWLLSSPGQELLARHGFLPPD